MPHMRHLLKKMTIPHSIFESRKREPVPLKFALCLRPRGFTGTRCGYTVIPKELFRGGMSLNQMWVRNRTTKTNGVSYLIQKGASAVFTEEGQRQIREGIQIYKKNGRCLTEVTGSARHLVLRREKRSLYLDEMPEWNGKLGVF